MNQTLYLEGYSGISGDMLVAALLDLGADEAVLCRALESLPVNGFEIKISRVRKNGLDACDFSVILDKSHENHDHDMEYLHGGKSQGQHDHEHRNLQDILHVIHHGDMSVAAKELAGRIFTILAQAEAAAHGVPQDEVHFHEVGAVDSIADIVAIAVCIDNLQITQVIVPCLYEGCGFVKCQHGMIPVPVPAVLHIAKQYGIRLHMTGTEGEFVTPTGAAAVAALQTSDRLPDQFTVRGTGIGAGKRTYEKPSLLRAMLIQAGEQQEHERDVIWKLESNIDDCSGEALGYVMERLFASGAKDVHYMPVFMKKNRPAYQLNVICAEEDISGLEGIIFKETTTIGIRRICMERTILKRKIQPVQTSLGEIQVKICELPGERRVYPEYESIIEKCKEHKMSYRQVCELVSEQCKLTE